jgi:hypothetical protein
MGKNNWNYQQWKGAVHDELHFRESIGVFSNYWSGEGNCRIGPDYQIADAGAVVRAWVAPHGGAVRIEGRATVDQAGQAAWAGIEKNQGKAMAGAADKADAASIPRLERGSRARGLDIFHRKGGRVHRRGA